MSEARLQMEQRMRQIEEYGRDTDTVGLIRECAEAFARFFQQAKDKKRKLPPCKKTLAKRAREGRNPPLKSHLPKEGR